MVDEDERRTRLARLLELVTECVRSRDLIPMVEHAQQVATERFHAGYDISEVQCAFNVLEETVWLRLLANVPTTDMVEAAGLLSTVLGAGKGAFGVDIRLARQQAACAHARPQRALPGRAS